MPIGPCTCPVCDAKALGCELTLDRGRWHWSVGRHARSSNDHYGVSFQSEMEAAVHFIKSRGAQSARRALAR